MIIHHVKQFSLFLLRPPPTMPPPLSQLLLHQSVRWTCIHWIFHFAEISVFCLSLGCWTFNNKHARQFLSRNNMLCMECTYMEIDFLRKCLCACECELEKYSVLESKTNKDLYWVYVIFSTHQQIRQSFCVEPHACSELDASFSFGHRKNLSI